MAKGIFGMKLDAKPCFRTQENVLTGNFLRIDGRQRNLGFISKTEHQLGCPANIPAAHDQIEIPVLPHSGIAVAPRRKRGAFDHKCFDAGRRKSLKQPEEFRSHAQCRERVSTLPLLEFLTNRRGHCGFLAISKPHGREGEQSVVVSESQQSAPVHRTAKKPRKAPRVGSGACQLEQNGPFRIGRTGLGCICFEQEILRGYAILRWANFQACALAGKPSGQTRRALECCVPTRKEARKSLGGLLRNLLQGSRSVHGLEQPAIGLAFFG